MDKRHCLGTYPTVVIRGVEEVGGSSCRLEVNCRPALFPKYLADEFDEGESLRRRLGYPGKGKVELE